jgi:hypothetical protein
MCGPLVEDLVDQYYILEKGARIEKVDEYISLGTGIKIRRRLLKHIVEQRMDKDHMLKEEIKEMMARVPNAIEFKEFETFNSNQGTFPGSVIIGKLYKEIGKGLLVVKGDKHDFQEIFDAFYREEKRFNKFMEKQRLNLPRRGTADPHLSSDKGCPQ